MREPLPCSKMEYWFLQAILLFLLAGYGAKAQTEGDPGYEYLDAYDDFDNDAVGYEPVFDVPIVNVTVVEGQTAVLPCSINYLGKYKVAWVDQNRIPLTYEDRRVVDDTSFSIVRPFVKEWNLQITHVKYEYQGQYRCTINTTPEPKYKTVMLYVKVAARIIDELSSDDVTIQEHETIVLVCNVTGIPHPTVTWFRRPANGLPSEKQKVGMSGEMIIIQNVSRYCDNIYECVASNGVPPDQSRQMRVTVEFPPEITLRNKRMGQILGSKHTILECVITAFPHQTNNWQKDGKNIQSDNKHTVDAFHEGGHTLILSLTIHDLEEKDYGKYTCLSVNPLGSDQESMWLYHYEKPDKDNPPTPTKEVIVVPASPTSPLWPGKTTKNTKGIHDENNTGLKPSEPLIDASGSGGDARYLCNSRATWGLWLAVTCLTFVLMHTTV